MKKVKLLTAVFCLLFSNFLTSQVTDYEKFIGEPSRADFFNDTQATPDGGFVAVGQTQVANERGNVYLVKFSIDGFVQLTADFGNFANESAEAVAVLGDRYIVGGSKFQHDENTNNCYLLAVGLDGTLLEEVVFGGEGEDVIYSVAALDNGNVAVASTFENDGTGADINVRIYDTSLNLIAENTYASDNLEVPNFIIEANPGGDILVSGYQNFPEREGLILSFSNDLTTINWGIISDDEEIYYSGVKLTNDEFLFVSKSDYDELNVNRIDIIDGSVSSTNFVANASFTNNIDIATNGDIAYVLDNGELYYFSILNNSILSQGSPFFGGVALSVHEGFNSVGIAGQNDVGGAIVGEMQQYNGDSFFEEWIKRVGDFTPEFSSGGIAISEAEDGGMYLAGRVDFTEESDDAFVRKVNVSGETIWSVTLGNPFLQDVAWAVTTANDGGCVVVYNTGNNMRTFQKISSDGDLEWSQPIGNGDNLFNIFGNVVTAPNGNYFYTYTSSSNGRKAKVAHVSASGDIIWENEYQIDGLGTRGYNIAATANGDILVACQIESSPREPGMLRINSDGDVLWANIYETNSSSARFTGVAEAPDGTIYGAGLVSTVDDFGGGPGNIFHLNADGSIISGGELVNNEYGKIIYDIAVKEDGSVHTVNLVTTLPPENAIFTTQRSRTLEIHEHDEVFAVIENQSFSAGLSPGIGRIMAHSDGGLAVYGAATLNNISYEHLIRIDAEGASSTVEIKSQGILKLLPTVSNGQFAIDFKSPHTGAMTVKIYNTNGQIVSEFEAEKMSDNWQKTVNLQNVPAGNYFVNIRLKDYAWTQQLLKQ